VPRNHQIDDLRILDVQVLLGVVAGKRLVPSLTSLHSTSLAYQRHPFSPSFVISEEWYYAFSSIPFGTKFISIHF
jgi:hypothetical protein